MDDLDELELVALIREGNEKAFEYLFFKYHIELSRFAISITKSREFARDVVQDVFLKIWRNRENWEINVGVRVYLFQSVKNQALNLLEKQNSQLRIISGFRTEMESLALFGMPGAKNNDGLTDLQRYSIKQIWAIVENMPEKRRMVFELNRRHGLSYKEIAKVLDITRKTVENHIANALQDIRDQILLKDMSKKN
ncbi:MAG: RNA polymerase sigma-70 factor [Gracilimonas sp.]|uniref:RNA polymerase sigma-70 factor n=1 Tax=Gracilimonas sp. TaxID=1974203 RepID=UPI00198A6E32|nr:RNA polymerase sigma-70 factor [Gracilimonas sp.]MBD3616509.1 RNA polymerase sigma-70 factor [Gracilimonas sp.]